MIRDPRIGRPPRPTGRAFSTAPPSILPALLALFLLVSVGAPRASAGERDILYLAKNAIYGGITGLLLGGVTALIVDADQRDDAVRWGIAIGTFGGFAYGVYGLGQNDEDFFRSAENERPRPQENGLAERRDRPREAGGRPWPGETLGHRFERVRTRSVTPATGAEAGAESEGHREERTRP